eukprot:snap_masked-scaffold80_size398941-processed-gene-2.8 protein:Tk02823 transcript:snap_masked-scaffold80_size398941-processed-gene-2.8-mRNA-1 annotation:"proline synthase co-transcribed bacterial homolog protein"
MFNSRFSFVRALTTSGSTMASESSIGENLKSILDRVHQAYDMSPDNVRANEMPRLVAVSKTKPRELIIEAYEAGQRTFGENYVQELQEKSNDPEILSKCPDIRWHFIGHCQSSNVNKILKSQNLALMETISSMTLANKIDARCRKEEKTLNILVQVNTSGEENKYGVAPGQDTIALVEHILEKCPNLTFKGLMTIGAYGNSSLDQTDTTKANPDFVKLKETRQKVADVLKVPEQTLELSMGMSHDFGEAVRMGSTNVRVGSSIFGARDYSNKSNGTQPEEKDVSDQMAQAKLE